jgi:hypothetical protein
MATKKAPVAGSVQGPAIINLDTSEGSAPETAADQVDPQPFPRQIVIANETPMNYSIGGTYVPAGDGATITVRDEDEITRIKTDCEHLMALSPAHAALEVQPLRVIDAAADE